MHMINRNGDSKLLRSYNTRTYEVGLNVDRSDYFLLNCMLEAFILLAEVRVHEH